MNTAPEDIKARLNIVEIVGQYVKLEKAGINWKARCPFHNEKTPSFMVSEERQSFHCFGCNKGGDVFTFLMELESVDFKEALSLLAERANVDLSAYRKEGQTFFDTEKESLKPRISEILELSTKFFEKQLWDGAGKKKILEYLHERGLSEESIRRFRLGYAPEGWRHLFDFLIGRGYRAEEIEAAGLVIKKSRERHAQASSGEAPYYDRFRDRILFPIEDTVGRVIGYSARMAPGGDESQAKYINTPETAVYRKSKVLYGLSKAKQNIKQKNHTVIVEGNMDVIAVHQAGVTNAVAVSGTALTGEQLDILKRYSNRVKFFFDMDGAGQAAAKKSTELALGKEMEVSIIAIPFGKDAADMGKENPELLRDAIAKDVLALEYFLEKSARERGVDTPSGKRAIVDEYLPILACAENTVDRGHFLSKLAFRIGIDERELVDGLERTRRARKNSPSGSQGETSKSATTAATARRIDTRFIKRSEILREKIIGLLLVSRAAREEAACFSDENMVRFLSQDPLFSLAVRAGQEGKEPLDMMSDPDIKSRGTKLSFEAEESYATLPSNEEENRPAFDRETLSGYREQLFVELRKERLAEISRALEEARMSGNKTREKELLAEFAELSKQ